jgi:hypothetical protein
MNTIIECLELCACCGAIIAASDDYSVTESGFVCVKCKPLAPVKSDAGFFYTVTIAVVLGVISGLSQMPSHNDAVAAQSTQGVRK